MPSFYHHDVKKKVKTPPRSIESKGESLKLLKITLRGATLEL